MLTGLRHIRFHSMTRITSCRLQILKAASFPGRVAGTIAWVLAASSSPGSWSMHASCPARPPTKCRQRATERFLPGEGLMCRRVASQLPMLVRVFSCHSNLLYCWGRLACRGAPIIACGDSAWTVVIQGCVERRQLWSQDLWLWGGLRPCKYPQSSTSDWKVTELTSFTESCVLGFCVPYI